MIPDFAVTGQLRILLLEDNEPDAYLFLHKMKQAGWRPLRSSGHTQAIHRAARKQPLRPGARRLSSSRWTGMDALGGGVALG